MATKGDKGYLEPQARRLYADGHTISAIAEQLDVSATSLSRWKAETLVPGNEQDEWDRARYQKRGNIQRLRDLFEEQLEHLERLRPEERTAPLMDTLSKMGALLERWDKFEKTQRVAEDIVKEVTKAGLSADTAAEIRRQILGINA